jgi:hypothetical protein
MSVETREAGLLNIGDQILSPAGRWETIEHVDNIGKPGGGVRIWTDATGNGYSWRFTSWHRLRFVERKYAEPRVVKIFETPEQIIAALAGERDLVWPSDSVIVVDARKHAGGSWEVTDRPGGGEPVVQPFPRRGSARAAVRRAARLHAKAIGVPVAGDALLARMGSRQA